MSYTNVKSENTDPEETLMKKRMRKPVTDTPGDTSEPYDNKAQEFAFVQGFTDETGLPIDDDDYYGYLGSLNFYDAEKYPWFWPLGRDTNTTTAIRYYDTRYQKTPLDTAEDPEPNLSKVALDNKEANLWNIQDFSETAAKRILEKTHRIQYDPDRRIQAQILSDIQKEKGRLLDPKIREHPLEVLLSYNEMNLKVNTMLLNRMTDILDYQEKQYTFSKYEVRPKGMQFYAEMTLTSGAPATKFDFTDDRYNLNVPTNIVMYRYPYHNLLSLLIIFESGTDLYYSTNEPNNSLDAFIKFDTTSLPARVSFTPGQFAISSLNLRADGGTNGFVKIIGLY